MIRAILFDLDNTLIDRDAAFNLFCHEALQRFWPDLSTTEQADALSWMRRRDQQFLMRDLPPDIVPLGELLERPLEEQASSPADWQRQIWSAPFVAEKRLRLPQLVRLEPSVERLLQRLSQRFALAIITNGSSRVQRMKLQATKLDSIIEKIVVSEELGVAKPNAAIFQKGLSLVGCEAHACLFVGDDPVCDVTGAKGVGMQVCWVQRGRDWDRLKNDFNPDIACQPDYCVENVCRLEAEIPWLMPTH